MAACTATDSFCVTGMAASNVHARAPTQTKPSHLFGLVKGEWGDEVTAHIRTNLICILVGGSSSDRMERN